MRLSLSIGLATALSWSLVASTASAQTYEEDIAAGVFDKETWPLETIHRPLTLAGGMLEISGDTFIVGIGGGDFFDFGQPIALAPDIHYGIDSQLTVGITHSNRLFRWGGFCLSGADGGCPKGYNGLGAEAKYALTRGGNLGLAAHGGLATVRLSDPFVLGLNAGMEMRIKAGKIAVVVDPSVRVGIAGRDALKEWLMIPVDLQYQLNTQTMLYLTSGVLGPFDGFGDGYRIPVGLGANFAVNNRVDIGGEINVANLAGKAPDLGPSRFDERYFIARAAIRL